MKLQLHTYNLVLKHTFTISRESRNTQPTLIVELSDDGFHGFGETSSNTYYKITMDDLNDQITENKEFIESLSDATPDEFWNISAKGMTLRKLHLMESETIDIMTYPLLGEGDIVVDNPYFEEGRLWINQTQYFDDVPEISWGFRIGGYQPAQKWLKDRKGHKLMFEDVKHYQNILIILSETDRIMKTIEMQLPE